MILSRSKPPREDLPTSERKNSRHIHSKDEQEVVYLSQDSITMPPTAYRFEWTTGAGHRIQWRRPCTLTNTCRPHELRSLRIWTRGRMQTSPCLPHNFSPQTEGLLYPRQVPTIFVSDSGDFSMHPFCLWEEVVRQSMVSLASGLGCRCAANVTRGVCKCWRHDTFSLPAKLGTPVAGSMECANVAVHPYPSTDPGWCCRRSTPSLVSSTAGVASS